MTIQTAVYIICISQIFYNIYLYIHLRKEKHFCPFADFFFGNLIAELGWRTIEELIGNNGL